MEQIKIISEQKDFLVVYKPSGLPSAPISSNDFNNALMETANFYPEILDVKGRKEIEHGLVHRLDTVTRGLILIARNQNGYEYLQELQKENKIIKTYSAICEINNSVNQKEGFPNHSYNILNNNKITVTSYFRAFGEGRKEVRPVTDSSGAAALKKLEKKVEYITDIEIIKKQDKKIIVECKITNGYRHQIRCHLAWIGLPIIGDPVYNKKSTEEMDFCATKIEIPGTRFELA